MGYPTGLTMNRLALLACSVTLLTASSAARAQSAPSSVEAKAKAKQFYEDGVTNYNLGHYTQALGAFESGYRLRRDPSFLFNIAQCERNLSQYEEAERSYRAYLRESPGLPEAERDRIQRLISEMEKAVRAERAKQPPTGTQPPAGTIPGEPSMGSLAPSVAPNEHRVIVRGPNAAELQSARRLKIASYATGGLGVLALGLGGMFTGLASDANGQVVKGATWVPATEDRRNTYQALDATFFAVGGAAVVAGVTIYLIGRHTERRSYPAEPARAGAAPDAPGSGLTVVGGL